MPVNRNENADRYRLHAKYPCVRAELGYPVFRITHGAGGRQDKAKADTDLLDERTRNPAHGADPPMHHVGGGRARGAHGQPIQMPTPAAAASASNPVAARMRKRGAPMVITSASFSSVLDNTPIPIAAAATRTFAGSAP